MITQMGEEGFRWFIGVVDDIKDPLKLGRVRVRVVNEHDTSVQTADIPWASVMMPTTSASFHGVGDTPNLALGSSVIGFYLDTNEKQLMMILGSFPIIPDMDTNKHSISSLAREKQSLTKEKIGPEPGSAYAAQYPYNRVIQTRAGHVIEIDDTPENSRIHVYHKSGTYFEINDKGQRSTKIVDNDIEVIIKNKTVYIQGNYDLQVDGDYNTVVHGDASLTVNGKYSLTTAGTATIESSDVVNLRTNSSLNISAPAGVSIPEGSLFTGGAVGSGTGVTGTFTSVTGHIVTVEKGLVTNIS